MLNTVSCPELMMKRGYLCRNVGYSQSYIGVQRYTMPGHLVYLHMQHRNSAQGRRCMLPLCIHKHCLRKQCARSVQTSITCCVQVRT